MKRHRGLQRRAAQRGPRALSGAVGPVLGLLALVGAVVGCGPDPGLRIETPQGVPTPTVSAPPPAGPADQPFSADEIREAVIDDTRLASQSDASQVHEILLMCSECIELAEPFTADGQKFQIGMVSMPSDDRIFAGVVVSQVETGPRLNLIVSGHDLSLTPGRGDTLVAQESTFRAGDPECCPSGWSVRVYRYQNGGFEPGQRITQNTGG